MSSNQRAQSQPQSQPIPAYNKQAIEAYTSAPIPDAQQARRRAIDRGGSRTRALPAHDPSEPFHSTLVEKMDHDLDLFDRGDERFCVPPDILSLVRSGAEVTGVVAYDRAFARKPDPYEPPVQLQHLFSQQDAYYRSVEKQVRRYKRDARLLLWSSLEKEISQGFGGVHLSLPAPELGPPDVFVKRFPVAQVIIND